MSGRIGRTERCRNDLLNSVVQDEAVGTKLDKWETPESVKGILGSSIWKHCAEQCQR